MSNKMLVLKDGKVILVNNIVSIDYCVETASLIAHMSDKSWNHIYNGDDHKLFLDHLVKKFSSCGNSAINLSDLEDELNENKAIQLEKQAKNIRNNIAKKKECKKQC